MVYKKIYSVKINKLVLMSLILMDNEHINLSSSPNYSMCSYTSNNYKLYENKINDNILEIYGTFFIINNNIQKAQEIETFFNLESLYIRLNNTNVNLNMYNLELENEHGNICNCIYSTKSKNIGETIQKEFFITDAFKIGIKVIKNINNYKNIVEISSIIKMSTEHMNRMNSILNSIFERRLKTSLNIKTRSKPILIPKSQY